LKGRQGRTDQYVAGRVLKRKYEKSLPNSQKTTTQEGRGNGGKVFTNTDGSRNNQLREIIEGGKEPGENYRFISVKVRGLLQIIIERNGEVKEPI